MYCFRFLQLLAFLLVSSLSKDRCFGRQRKEARKKYFDILLLPAILYSRLLPFLYFLQILFWYIITSWICFPNYSHFIKKIQIQFWYVIFKKKRHIIFRSDWPENCDLVIYINILSPPTVWLFHLLAFLCFPNNYFDIRPVSSPSSPALLKHVVPWWSWQKCSKRC